MFTHVSDIPTMWFIIGISVFAFVMLTWMGFGKKPQSNDEAAVESLPPASSGFSMPPIKAVLSSSPVAITGINETPEVKFAFSGDGLVLEKINAEEWRVYTNNDSDNTVKLGDSVQLVNYHKRVVNDFYHVLLALNVPALHTLDANGDFEYRFVHSNTSKVNASGWQRQSLTPFHAYKNKAVQLHIRVPAPLGTGATIIALRKVPDSNLILIS